MFAPMHENFGAVADGFRVCGTCGFALRDTEFWIDSRTGRHRHSCKKCATAKAENTRKEKADRTRRREAAANSADASGRKTVWVSSPASSTRKTRSSSSAPRACRNDSDREQDE